MKWTPEQRNRHLAAATARIDSTTELLDQLFAYTKSTDPDLALAHEPVALTPLVERVLLGHYPEFEAHGWEPSLEVDDAAATVMGDSEADSPHRRKPRNQRHPSWWRAPPASSCAASTAPHLPRAKCNAPIRRQASTAGSGHTSYHLELRISNPVHDPTSHRRGSAIRALLSGRCRTWRRRQWSRALGCREPGTRYGYGYQRHNRGQHSCHLAHGAHGMTRHSAKYAASIARSNCN